MKFYKSLISSISSVLKQFGEVFHSNFAVKHSTVIYGLVCLLKLTRNSKSNDVKVGDHCNLIVFLFVFFQQLFNSITSVA